jgi:hypothetical protein
MGGGRRSLDTILGPRRSMDARLSMDSNASEAAAMVRGASFTAFLHVMLLRTAATSAWLAAALLSRPPEDGGARVTGAKRECSHVRAAAAGGCTEVL